MSARSANVSGAERARAAVGQASEIARIAMPERRPNAPNRGGRRRDSRGCGVEIEFLFNVPVLLVVQPMFRRGRIADRRSGRPGHGVPARPSRQPGTKRRRPER